MRRKFLVISRDIHNVQNSSRHSLIPSRSALVEMTASPKQSLRQTTLRKTHIQRQQALNGSIKDKKQTILAAPRRPLDPDIAMTDSTSDESHLQAAKSPKAQAAPQKRSKPAREVQRYHSQSLRVSPEELRLQKYEELGQFRDTPKGTLWWLAVSSQTSSQALMK